MSSKIASVDVVAEKARSLQKSDKRVVFTNGCYDLLHPGHVDFLYRARQLGDALVVAINTDDSVRRLKGPSRPIFNDQDRSEVLAALEMVDAVCTFPEDTPLKAILMIRPDVLVKGADWGLDAIVGRQEVEGWGGTVVALPLIAGQSTTGVVERVRSRYPVHGNPGKTNQ